RHDSGVLAQPPKDRPQLAGDLAQRRRTRRGRGRLGGLDQQCLRARDARGDQRAGLRVDLTGSAHVGGAELPQPTREPVGAGGGRRHAAAHGIADVDRAGVVVGALDVASARRRREGRGGGRAGGRGGGRRAGGRRGGRAGGRGGGRRAGGRRGGRAGGRRGGRGQGRGPARPG